MRPLPPQVEGDPAAARPGRPCRASGHRQLGQRVHGGRHAVVRAARRPPCPRHRCGSTPPGATKETRSRSSSRSVTASRQPGTVSSTVGDRVQLDPEAPHLDLVIGAAEVFEFAVGRPAAQVAGAEHQAAAAQERVRGVPLGVERGVVQVAGGDAVAAGPHLADLADAAGPTVGVEDVDGVVRRRPADGERPAGPVPVHRVDDGGLGRPAAVVEGPAGGPAVGQRARAGLARDGDHPYPVAPVQVDPAEHRSGWRSPRRRGRRWRRCPGRGRRRVPPWARQPRISQAAMSKATLSSWATRRPGRYPRSPGVGEQDVGDVAVGDLDAVGVAGGAGGEQHVAAVVGAYRPVRDGGGRCRPGGSGSAITSSTASRATPGAPAPRPGRAEVVSTTRGRGGRDDVPQLRGGRDADVLRDVGRARLQRRQDADQHRDGAAGEEADVVPGPYARGRRAGRRAGWPGGPARRR